MQDYIATEADVTEVTRQYLEATTNAEAGRQTYLRMLAATSIKELGSVPKRSIAGRPRRLSQEEQAQQLAAIATVHERFYNAVLQVVEESLHSVPAKERAIEKNRRSNFARTALYALRLYVRAGKDLTALDLKKLSKSALAVVVPQRPPTARRLKGRVDRASKVFVTALLALSEADKDTARAELDSLIGILAAQIATLGVSVARDMETAIAEHRPFRSGATLFLPTQTSIIRQRSNPS